MANTVIKLIDNTRRVVFKLVGNGSEARTLKIDPATTSGALNANNKLLGSGTDRKSKYRTYLKSAWWDISSGTIELSSDGDGGANVILNMSGQNQFPPVGTGENYIITVADGTANPNSTGNVFVTTGGFPSTNVGYTVILDFRKDPADYDQGQLENPQDFNR